MRQARHRSDGENCGQKDAQLGRINVLYYDAQGGTYVPRPVFFDLEPGVIIKKQNKHFRRSLERASVLLKRGSKALGNDSFGVTERRPEQPIRWVHTEPLPCNRRFHRPSW
jgi:hypothetical protein